jgi:PAS domain S-box-containing protein
VTSGQAGQKAPEVSGAAADPHTLTQTDPDQPPRRPRQGLGVMPKLILVFAPLFLLLNLAFMRVLIASSAEGERAALWGRVEPMSSRLAISAGKLADAGNTDEIGDLLAALSGDRGFLCAEAIRADGTRIAAWPTNGCEAIPDPAGQIVQPLHPASGMAGGKLVLRYSEAALRAASARIVVLLLGSLTVAFVVALIGIWIGYRSFVGRPVARLLESIRRGAGGGPRPPVDWPKYDEMGRIVSEYNAMLRCDAQRVEALLAANVAQHDVEAQLLSLNGELEERIRTRTQELAVSEARSRAIIETIAEAVITADGQGRAQSANRAAEEMFGIRAEDIVGGSLSALLAEAASDPPGLSAVQLLATVTLDTPLRGRRLTGRRADGSTFPLVLSATEVPLPDQRSAFKSPLPETRLFTLGLRDITAQLRLEDGLRAARDSAERSNRTRSDFVAVMSHELRTPLNGVLGMTGLLLDGKLDPQSRRYVETLKESGDHLLQLINDVLDFTKLDADRLEFEKVPFGIDALVQSALDLLSPRAYAKGLDVGASIGANVPKSMIGDPGRLRQVLINLFGNAIKFTERGTVSVDVQRLSGPGPDVRLCVEVRDTGIGIAEESLPLLFREFGQLDSSIARRFGGAGLGLAISKRLIAGMGGTITAESEFGHGSVFRFTVRLREDQRGGEDALPARRRPPGTRPALIRGRAEPGPARRLEMHAGSLPALEFAALQQPGHVVRVLVAEDNPTNQAVVRAMLERLGHRADIVSDGMEVLEAVRARPYDVLLLGIAMPQVNGMEATRRIRALPPPLCRLLIIGLTSHFGSDEREAALKCGMDDVIGKPVTLASLSACLAPLLASRGAMDA